MRVGRARARFVASRSTQAGLSLLGGLLAFVSFAPLLSRHGPLESDFAHGITPELTPVGPGAAFPLGADALYRDVMVRLAFAGRLSLAIAAGATLLACALGTVVGVASGWTQGRRVQVPWTTLLGVVGLVLAMGLDKPGFGLGAVLIAICARRVGARFTAGLDVDGILMRLVDLLLTFPFLLLVMSLAMAFERTSAVTVFLSLGVTGWLGIARLLRSRTLQVRSLEYIEASRALGASTAEILLRHVLPSVAGPLLGAGTVLMAQMLVADSVLSYLGVGISPPTPTWGRMLFESKDDILGAPWLVAAPGVAIVAAVCGCNLLGEGLRDALDPRAS